MLNWVFNKNNKFFLLIGFRAFFIKIISYLFILNDNLITFYNNNNNKKEKEKNCYKLNDKMNFNFISSYFDFGNKIILNSCYILVKIIIFFLE